MLLPRDSQRFLAVDGLEQVEIVGAQGRPDEPPQSRIVVGQQNAPLRHWRAQALRRSGGGACRVGSGVGVASVHNRTWLRPLCLASYRARSAQLINSSASTTSDRSDVPPTLSVTC